MWPRLVGEPYDDIEHHGTGTFGAGLSRYLLAQHVQVYEVNRSDRTARRLLGKSNPLDAQAAARAVLSGRARARAKTGDGPMHSARMFKLAKDSAVKARTQAINQLKAVLVIADPALWEGLSSPGKRKLFRTCARFGLHDGGGDEGAVVQATCITLSLLAQHRWSSRRLNHGGDRQANAALYRVGFTRLRHDPRTQAYYERHTQEGKTRREIIRCLKRYGCSSS